MSTPIEIDITSNKDDFDLGLAEVLDLIGDTRAAAVAAEGIAAAIEDNFLLLAATRHRSDSPHNFYASAARSITTKGGTITISKTGIAQRYYGGDIVPVKAKKLTIPSSEAPPGKTARDIDGLFKITTKKGLEMLCIKATDGIVPMFWLKDKIHQDPDPTVLPTSDAMTNAALDAIESSLPQ